VKRIVRVLLVGVGRRGRWPVERCRRENGWRVVGLVDRTRAHLEKAAELTGLAATACFRDAKAALAATRPEAMIVCTPTVTHVALAKLAIDRGVAVLVEKGMAPCWADALELVRYACAKEAVVAVAQNYRYDGVSAIVRLVLRGDPPAIAQPFLLDYVQHRVRPQPRTLTYPFASVWDMSCHHFDNLLDWLGPVAEITAHSYRAGYTPYQHDNNTSAFLRFRSGVAVNYVHTHDASRGSLRIEVHGANGAFVLRDERAELSPRPAENFGVEPTTEIPVPTIDSEAGVLADFHDYITTGREPGIAARQNLETMAMCEMMVRSILERRTVRREELETV
jgi:predicted dehydrogenase